MDAGIIKGKNITEETASTLHLFCGGGCEWRDALVNATKITTTNAFQPD